jgi:DNA-binding transcriptional regulator YdaS (Cro superfamily)
MFDTATTALLRAVLDEVCESVSARETGARTHVASKNLEAATRGDVSPEDLRRVRREALSGAPTSGAESETRR